ncbi:hypothetical protein ACH3XW_49650 [Acanthocheilonema viteae]
MLTEVRGQLCEARRQDGCQLMVFHSRSLLCQTKMDSSWWFYTHPWIDGICRPIGRSCGICKWSSGRELGWVWMPSALIDGT